MKFTLREMILFVLVAGLMLGWWLDRRQLSARATMWESRAEYVKKVFKDDTGWNTYWLEHVASFNKDGDPRYADPVAPSQPPPVQVSPEKESGSAADPSR